MRSDMARFPRIRKFGSRTPTGRLGDAVDTLFGVRSLGPREVYGAIVRSIDYGEDVLSGKRGRKSPPAEVVAEPGLVVEDTADGFCGAVVRLERGDVTKHNVILEDRDGAQRAFPMRPGGFLLEGRRVTLVPPASGPRASTRSASGSVRAERAGARSARASRIWVEGLHDAELVERVWGHDLRVAGVVVEPLHGLDDLKRSVDEFAPAPHRRLGILVDHLLDGTKEARIAEEVRCADVEITGHPYVDIWQAVRPESLGIPEWPTVERHRDWKTGVCASLGWGEPADGWRKVLAAVGDFRDLQAPLIGAVEKLIDFVTCGEETD